MHYDCKSCMSIPLWNWLDCVSTGLVFIGWWELVLTGFVIVGCWEPVLTGFVIGWWEHILTGFVIIGWWEPVLTGFVVIGWCGYILIGFVIIRWWGHILIGYLIWFAGRSYLIWFAGRSIFLNGSCILCWFLICPSGTNVSSHFLALSEFSSSWHTKFHVPKNIVILLVCHMSPTAVHLNVNSSDFWGYLIIRRELILKWPQIYIRIKFCMVQFCAVIFEMPYRTHSKKS